MPLKHGRQVSKVRKKKAPTNQPRCGLCGKSGRLTKTSCCNRTICNDEDQYVLFSYARNSCHRNHTRYTLCGFHYNEGHEGTWKECQACRDTFETELYVDSGTNAYNFEKLTHVPSYQSTHCLQCNKVIRLAEEGYSPTKEGYLCEVCASKQFNIPL